MERERRRLQYLEAMGIQVWVPRSSPPQFGKLETPAWGETESFPSLQQENRHTETGRAPPLSSYSREPPAPAILHSADANVTLTPPTAGLDWNELEMCVRNCTTCALHRTRTQTVFGVGNRSASWMVIGEAPGEQEDLKGEPFVGRAGQLLNEMLRAIGLSRAEVYIANVLKCRPPRNRDPTEEEADACEAFLKRQVALISPRIILATGRIAAQNLLRTATAIGKLRGNVYRYQDIPLVVTYHPAYLLRSPGEKRKAWEDLRLAERTFRA